MRRVTRRNYAPLLSHLSHLKNAPVRLQLRRVELYLAGWKFRRDGSKKCLAIRITDGIEENVHNYRGRSAFAKRVAIEGIGCIMFSLPCPPMITRFYVTSLCIPSLCHPIIPIAYREQYSGDSLIKRIDSYITKGRVIGRSICRASDG